MSTLKANSLPSQGLGLRLPEGTLMPGAFLTTPLLLPTLARSPCSAQALAKPLRGAS